MKMLSCYALLLLLLAAPFLHAEQTSVAEPAAPMEGESGAAQPILTEQTRTALVNLAIELLDTTYRYGGSSPLTGVDCSGLVRHVYETAAGMTLPHSSREMARGGTKVESSALLPGDLLFFARRPKQSVSHVGIYIGDGLFIHAASKGKKVKINELDQRYYRTRLVGARRYLPQ